ncbi:MAG: SIS domain-containing protein [Lentisphaeria bacterium]|nr:SIS domain-containing protein [Lentisphaeria bacterium]
MMQDLIKQAFDDAAVTLAKFQADERNYERLEALAKAMVKTYESGGKILICGNGGSMCDALHFAEELTGRFRKNRRPLPAMALGEATHTTCVGNDFGFEEIFARGVEAFGKPEDILIGLSTSGNSANIIRAVEEAENLGLTTVLFSGKSGGKLQGRCDFEWVVPSNSSDRIQEVHMMCLHIVIEILERHLFPENYQGE